MRSPINEAVKRWTQQPWFHRSEIEKFHLIQPKRSLPYQANTPSKDCGPSGQQKGENIRYPPFTYFHHDEE